MGIFFGVLQRLGTCGGYIFTLRQLIKRFSIWPSPGVCYGKVARRELPAAIRAQSVGPDLAATLTYLAGRLRASKRAIQETCETLLDVPLSLGTISKLEAQTSAALKEPYAEALAAVRAAPIKNVDETGWAKQSVLCWLWLAATKHLAVFAMQSRRGHAGFTNLLGKEAPGIVCSDRWAGQKIAAFSNRLLKDYEALWLFANVEGVEPTHHHAERGLRPAVLWRKRSFWKSQCSRLPLHGADVDGGAHVEAAKASGVRVPKKRAAQPPRREAHPLRCGRLDGD